jgi:hypothetical protein
MPFKSEAQRRYLFAKEPAVAEEFAKETPKGKKLPEHIKKANLRGVLSALEHFGFKQASEELRLKIPSRTFHGLDAAHRPDSKRAGNGAAPDAPPDEGTSDALEAQLEQLETPVPPGDQVAARDPLDRQTAWGAPSNLSAGDTANRLSDMGQSTSFGGV